MHSAHTHLPEYYVIRRVYSYAVSFRFVLLERLSGHVSCEVENFIESRLGAIAQCPWDIGS